MIIDTHVHIGGKPLDEDLTPEMMINGLSRYNIDYAIVSSCDCVECDHEQDLLPKSKQISQVVALKQTLEFARNYKSKIGVAVWIKPQTEQLTQEFVDLIKNNLDIIYAIKLHPYHSNISPTDKRVIPYIELASMYNLAIVSHTGGCECAEPQHLYELAKMFPSVPCVMVHLGLGSDNVAAIDLLSKQDNLFGDTTWVCMNSTIKAVKNGLSEKIMFGSDMPIDGVDTYMFNKFGQRSIYQDYFYELPKIITQNQYNQIMSQNAIKIFNLTEFNK